MSAKKLTEKSVGRDPLLWAVWLLLAVVAIATESEVAWLFVAAGIVVWLWRAPPKLAGRGLRAVALPQIALAAGLAGSADTSVLTSIALFFAKAGAFVFGSGLAIVPFLYGGVVTEHHWLTEKQFVDAVAVAMITPGPVVITVGFIGYLVAGLPGATVAALATFLPCYLFTVLPAPYFKRYGKLPGVVAFVDGITAAAVGAIAGSVVIIAKRTIVDVPTALVAVATIVLLWRYRKLQEPVVIAAAAILGLVVHPLLAA
jgi:chromate transporter